MQAMARTPCPTVPRQLNEAVLQPVLISAKLYYGSILLATFCEKRNYLRWSFRGTKSFTAVQSSSSILAPKNAVRNHFWDSISTRVAASSYQKPKLKVEVHVRCLCTGIAGFWRLYTTSTVKPESSKNTKNTPFLSRLVFGTRTPQILNGASCHHGQLKEGLVHWNSLVSSFQVFLFVRYCQKHLKSA